MWGGSRLGSLDSPLPVAAAAAVPDPGPIGEAWVVWDECAVAGGEWAGRSLAEVVAAEPAAVLGPAGIDAAGGRFPVLAKIIDTAAWLSLQVHPDDATAARLEGPGHLGKTESWYVLDAAPGAEIILGTVPGTPDAAIRAAIRAGALDAVVERIPVHAGDVILVPAGTLHAIGPGILLYELQQSSDITYRVSDWGRPASAGRVLHVEQSLASVHLGPVVPPRAVTLRPDDRLTAIECDKFVADLVAVSDAPASLDTAGRSFHAVTVVAGAVVVAGAGWLEPLGEFESLVVPAAVGTYELRPAGRAAQAVVARVP